MTHLETVTEVCLVNPRTKEPDNNVLRALPELEGIGAQARWGVPITLSRTAREALGLQHLGSQFYVVGEGYGNRSPFIHNATAGLPDDLQRRVAWGTLMVQRPAPQPEPGSENLVFGITPPA